MDVKARDQIGVAWVVFGCFAQPNSRVQSGSNVSRTPLLVVGHSDEPLVDVLKTQGLWHICAFTCCHRLTRSWLSFPALRGAQNSHNKVVPASQSHSPFHQPNIDIHTFGARS